MPGRVNPSVGGRCRAGLTVLVPRRVNPSVGGRCRAGLTCAGESEPEWEVGAELDLLVPGRVNPSGR